MLNNRYFAMRHGRSLANEQQVIISDPANGLLAEYGLSAAGRRQATAASVALLPDDVLIYSSDFSRALQTAEIIREKMGAPRVTAIEALRERHFGDWERTSDSNYEKIWSLDRLMADRHEDGVESLNSVLRRTLGLVASLEQEYQDRGILLVSHGDTLQILQAALNDYSPTRHRDLPHFETAEIRQLA